MNDERAVNAVHFDLKPVTRCPTVPLGQMGWGLQGPLARLPGTSAGCEQQYWVQLRRSWLLGLSLRGNDEQNAD